MTVMYIRKKKTVKYTILASKYRSFLKPAWFKLIPRFLGWALKRSKNKKII